LGPTRRTAPVSSVGSSFTLGKGIDAGESPDERRDQAHINA
jgi:hypothetical protein